MDAATAVRIRDFEAREARPAGARWQVLVALVLGGVLLAAGILLFVAAHWDQLSPAARMGVVVGLLAGLHAGALLAAERFPALSVTLHGVGTVAAGAAIGMVGQIFNMQEHWPGVVMLWALCAAAGWYFLRDQFQQVMTLLLFPAWLVCEWSFRENIYRGNEIFLARIIAVLAAVYLTTFVHARRRVVFGILYAFGAVALVVSVAVLSAGWHEYAQRPVLPMSLQALAVLFMLGCVAVAAWRQRSAAVPVVATMIVTFLLPWLEKPMHRDLSFNASGYDYTIPSVAAYIVVGLLAGLYAWWGVRERSAPLVNFGVIAFALVVAWFYFSDLMDKLGRSLGLIGLGIVFLAGGWLLERFRRRLIAQMAASPGVQA